MNRGGWNSLVQGINVGYGLGEKYQQAKEREETERIMNSQVTDQQGAYDNYNAGIAAQDQATFGEGVPAVEGADRKGLGYSVAGRTFKEKPSEAQVYSAKLDKLSDYHMSKGDVQKAIAIRDYGVRAEQQASEKARREKIDALDREFEDYYKQAATDDGAISVVRKLMPEYNSDAQGFNDGHILAEASRPGGGVILTKISKQDGRVVGAKELTPEFARKLLDQAYLMRMKAAGGESRRFAMEQEGKDREFALKERGLGVRERAADTQEGYRAAQEREMEERIRTGNWGQLDANRAHADYYRNPPNQRAPRDLFQEELTKKYVEEASMVSEEKLPAVKTKYRALGLASLGPSLKDRILGANAAQRREEQGSGDADGNQNSPAPTSTGVIPGDPAYAEPSRGLGGNTFAERRDAALAEARRKDNIVRSQEYQALELQRRAALRNNNATAANAIMEKQKALLLAGQ